MLKYYVHLKVGVLVLSRYMYLDTFQLYSLHELEQLIHYTLVTNPLYTNNQSLIRNTIFSFVRVKIPLSRSSKQVITHMHKSCTNTNNNQESSRPSPPQAQNMPRRPTFITTEPSLQHTPDHIPCSSDCDEHEINTTTVLNLEVGTVAGSQGT